MTRPVLRTKQLLVVAGPPCAGKTTLVSRIRQGAVPRLCEQLGLGDPAGWTFVDATHLARAFGSSIERLAVHYDLIVQRTPQGYRYLPEILAQAENVVLLTLWTRAERLRQRSRARLVEGARILIRDPKNLSGNVRTLRRLWRRHRAFCDPAGVRRIYEDWFEFSSRYPTAPHWVLESSATRTEVAETFEAAKRTLLSAPGGVQAG